MRPDRLRLVAYEPALRGRWNALVRASKNGTFLFHRDFMEYHADRFEDGSLLALEGDDNVVALLPAALDRRDDGTWLASHPGLTYGGWVTDARMTAPTMLRLFELLRERAAAEGLTGLRYKAMPSCYHRLPAEEDLYALFVNDARLVRQDAGSAIDLAAAPAWSKGKRQALAKGQAAGVVAEQSDDLEGFMALLTQVLAAHDATPVHTVEELQRLRASFPDAIRLFAARREDRALAYVLVFDAGPTVHTQYMASSAEGRELGGLETVIHYLQHVAYADRRYLSFGISTEAGGRVLNHGLIGQKEMFGARTLVSPVYDLTF